MIHHFGDRLIEAVKKKGNPVCVGLDPRLEKIPKSIKKKAFADKNKTPTAQAADAIIDFNKGIIDAVADLVPVVKPQVAFYEIFGHEGIRAYEETLKYAKSKGLLTIADVKRNDIGSTAEAYAKAYLGEVEINGDEDDFVLPIFDADSLTINPYLGWDGVKPFVEECNHYGRGVFVMVKTSNPTSGDLQDLELRSEHTVYSVVGHLVDSWGANEIGESGYNFVGAVVGATYPDQARELRKIMPNTIFLVPGYGAQGGTAEDIKVCFNRDGLGAVVNNSRGIIFAYEGMGMDAESYEEAARNAVKKMITDLGC